MTVCESEENRRKAAWLVPGYILLAWFLCVVFQPLGFTNVPGRGNNNDLNDESLYDIINLQDDPQVDKSIYKFNLSVCMFVCLFVSNKRQNGLTDRAQIFSGNSRDPREGYG